MTLEASQAAEKACGWRPSGVANTAGHGIPRYGPLHADDVEDDDCNYYCSYH